MLVRLTSGGFFSSILVIQPRGSRPATAQFTAWRGGGRVVLSPSVISIEDVGFGRWGGDTNGTTEPPRVLHTLAQPQPPQKQLGKQKEEE